MRVKTCSPGLFVASCRANWIARRRKDAKENREGLFFAAWRLCAKTDFLRFLLLFQSNSRANLYRAKTLRRQGKPRGDQDRLFFAPLRLCDFARKPSSIGFSVSSFHDTCLMGCFDSGVQAAHSAHSHKLQVFSRIADWHALRIGSHYEYWARLPEFILID